MSIRANVTKNDESIVSVKWSFNCALNVKKSSPLQVKRTQGRSYTYHFELQCNLSCIPVTDRHESQKYKIEFFLITTSGKNDGSNPTDDAGVIPDCYRLPRYMWLTIGKDVTKHFFEKSPENKWQSRSISTDFPSEYHTFYGVLWIKFNSVGIGEIKVVRRMAELLDQQTHCDVQFVFESGQRVGGHVAILSISSPVFKHMFTNDRMTRQVDIADIQEDIFKDLLHYIYTGHTGTPLTETKAQSLYLAAEKYDIEGLREECVDVLLFDIQLNNAIDLMIWAEAHSIDSLREAAIKFVAEHFHTIRETTKWEYLAGIHPDLSVRVTRTIK
ncbi:speckle-type POZ protein-like [Daphnia carinata]|uniref:speckle-type POZ protein-like n=1 Tax=Daphnia carinata TaxID=120202 RepID=UPI00257A9CC3|nr:speckle-type POZ protein-like [Daphnia carinata]